ncbi:MAG: hypothetical protein OXR07_05940 [Nitrospira sp.]|nr:hypothetical protein [Nitrospira sp.]MDD9859620.1 hypothetical protein [Nitrospira sp.]
MPLKDTRIFYNNTTSVIYAAIPSALMSVTESRKYAEALNGQVSGTPYQQVELRETALTDFDNHNELKGRKLNARRNGILAATAPTDDQISSGKVSERKALIRQWIVQTMGVQGYSYMRGLVGDGSNQFTALEGIAEMVAKAAATDSNLSDDTKWADIKTILNYSFREWYEHMSPTWIGSGVNLKTTFYKATRPSVSIVSTAVPGINMTGTLHMANFVIYGG